MQIRIKRFLAFAGKLLILHFNVPAGQKSTIKGYEHLKGYQHTHMYS